MEREGVGGQMKATLCRSSLCIKVAATCDSSLNGEMRLLDSETTQWTSQWQWEGLKALTLKVIWNCSFQGVLMKLLTFYL
jgi:hypothetical protein